MGEPDKPLTSVIPKALLECINVLDREEPKASWKISKNSKGFSLVIRTFAAKTVTPLKDGQSASGCQQESHADKTTDDLLLKKPKRKYKSPSTVARDRARSLRFWKNFKKNFKKKSTQTTSLNNARRQPEDTILEQENTVHIESDSSGACNLISSQLDPDLDTSNLSDSHELVHSPEVLLVSSPEREQSLDCFVFRDTTDDTNSPDYCGNCFIRKADLKRCTGCSFVKYCSRDCQVEHWGSHRVLCRAIKGLKKPE